MLITTLVFLIGFRLALHLVYYLFFHWRWAVLVPADKRPPILNQLHTDFPGPFKRIPRSWTAFISDKPPIKLLGTERVEDNLDVPEPGRWILAFPLYFAITTKRFWHFRCFDRFDYVDRYYRPGAFTIKKLK